MTILLKLFKALNANQQPGQLALSFVLGMILGLTPLFFAHTLLTLALIFILRINLSAVFVSFIGFTGFAYLLDPVFNQVGLWILHSSALEPLFTDLYNNAFWRLMHFNNTLVLGSVLVAYLLSVPAFFAFLAFVRSYRQHFLNWSKDLEVVKWLQRSSKVKFVAEAMK